MEVLQNLKNMNEVFKYIQNTYPGWIMNILPSYPEEYSNLTKNWNEICELGKCKPQKILIVRDYSDENFLVFSELFSMVGFHVRTISEIQECVNCHNKAIPTKFMYEKLKEQNNVNLPTEWKNSCKEC
jgi:hypothetical protein